MTLDQRLDALNSKVDSIISMLTARPQLVVSGISPAEEHRITRLAQSNLAALRLKKATKGQLK
jgi:hypothetical protein